VSEGIDLPAAERGALLSERARIERLEAAIPQIEAALDGETDAVAIQATLTCLLWETLVQANWCGFYRRIDDRVLAVGPYQGAMGCLRIDFDRGVCGTAARTGEIQIVPDVSKVDHIACDPRTRSEIVLPVFDHEKTLRAVLDVDSPSLDGFSRGEVERLAALLERLFARAAVRF
jgi:GAF domain-containing protein